MNPIYYVVVYIIIFLGTFSSVFAMIDKNSSKVDNTNIYISLVVAIIVVGLCLATQYFHTAGITI